MRSDQSVEIKDRGPQMTGQGRTCIDNPVRSPVLTGELVPVDWHGLPVQVTNGPDRSSEVLFEGKELKKIYMVKAVRERRADTRLHKTSHRNYPGMCAGQGSRDIGI